MIGKYYKPTGAAMLTVVDWLIARKNVRGMWDAFLERFNYENTDLVIEDGKVVDVAYYTEEDGVERAIARLPALPSYATLGASLGVASANGLQIQGGGTIVLVMDEGGLAGHTELTAEELDKKYGIKYHVKDCPICGLWLSYDEKRCPKCGTEVTE